MAGFRCPDCGMALGFDPTGGPGARTLRYHREVLCQGRAWVEWRKARQQDKARRLSRRRGPREGAP